MLFSFSHCEVKGRFFQPDLRIPSVVLWMKINLSPRLQEGGARLTLVSGKTLGQCLWQTGKPWEDPVVRVARDEVPFSDPKNHQGSWRSWCGCDFEVDFFLRIGPPISVVWGCEFSERISSHDKMVGGSSLTWGRLAYMFQMGGKKTPHSPVFVWYLFPGFNCCLRLSWTVLFKSSSHS